MNSKSLVNFCLKPSTFCEVCKYTKFIAPPHNFTIGLCNYVHSSLQWLFIADPQSVFTVVLKKNLEHLRFEVVFWCLEWECCTFQIIDEKLKINFNSWILHYGFKLIKTVRLTCRGFHSWVVPSSLAEAMITSSSLTSDTLSSFFCWWRSFHSSSSTILPQLSAPPPASSSFPSPSKSTFPSEQQRDIWAFCYYLLALSLMHKNNNHTRPLGIIFQQSIHCSRWIMCCVHKQRIFVDLLNYGKIPFCQQKWSTERSSTPALLNSSKTVQKLKFDWLFFSYHHIFIIILDIIWKPVYLSLNWHHICNGYGIMEGTLQLVLIESRECCLLF